MEKKIDTLGSKVGNTFEVCARQEIRLHHGYRYAEPFFSEDLFGLVRIALPKKPVGFEQGEAYHDVAFIQQQRVNAVASFIYGSKSILEAD